MATVHDSTAHLPDGCDVRVAFQHGNDAFNGFSVEAIVAEAVRNMQMYTTYRSRLMVCVGQTEADRKQTPHAGRIEPRVYLVW